jgi:hypothetical protein
MHYYHAGRIDRCREVVDRYLRENPAANHDMSAVAALVNKDRAQA